jgi:hypothetical protein
MEIYVNSTKNPTSFRVLRNKEELFEYLSHQIDKSVANECTYFDLQINTNPKEE